MGSKVMFAAELLDLDKVINELLMRLEDLK